VAGPVGPACQPGGAHGPRGGAKPRRGEPAAWTARGRRLRRAARDPEKAPVGPGEKLGGPVGRRALGRMGRWPVHGPVGPEGWLGWPASGPVGRSETGAVPGGPVCGPVDRSETGQPSPFFFSFSFSSFTFSLITIAPELRIA
jgi:hypothetical protein